MSEITEKIGVVGLGYVGWPVAAAMARAFGDVIGFDISERRVQALSDGSDDESPGSKELIAEGRIRVGADAKALSDCSFLIVAVPTPIDHHHRPDLSPLLASCETVGKYLQSGACIVFESTVYPGVTEDICRPVLERVSGMKHGRDFSLGYSPERINPGDTQHTLERIIKIVSGDSSQTLDRVAKVYEGVIEAGVYRASSIKVAEAAKVIENTQRDLNIALMNELAIIFERMDLRTVEVLDAAATKWNFHRYTPGLVGGHCIGVDPYYLTTKAEELGYHPQVILAGRRINDDMGRYVARQIVKRLAQNDRPLKSSRVGILGLSFKENVRDIRNSRVPEVVAELREFGLDPIVHDPLADAKVAKEEYDISLTSIDDLQDLDALVLAVTHDSFMNDSLVGRVKKDGLFVDVKSALGPEKMPDGVRYWSL